MWGVYVGRGCGTGEQQPSLLGEGIDDSVLAGGNYLRDRIGRGGDADEIVGSELDRNARSSSVARRFRSAATAA